ncbi:MAG: DNA-directed RNA polymerase subunit omega [Bacillota bacterium]
MMGQPPLEELLKKVNEKYSLVVLAAKRARQVMEGDPKLVESKSNKPVTIAMMEVAQGKVSFKRTRAGIK